MPLYEYECEACGQRFEVIQKFSETSDTCRLCGKGPVERLQSAPGFQFKGTGWYITDYAQKGKLGGDSATTGKSEGGEKSDAKKSDAGDTSATKSESAASPSTTSSKS